MNLISDGYVTVFIENIRRKVLEASPGTGRMAGPLPENILVWGKKYNDRNAASPFADLGWKLEIRFDDKGPFWVLERV